MARETGGIASRARRCRQGIMSYHHGRYRQAVCEFEPLANSADQLGRTAARYLSLAHQQIGLAALRQGRLERAERHLRAAMKGTGRRVKLHGRLASVYARTGRYDRCADVLEEALSADDRSAGSWRRLAQAQWLAGNRTQAHMTLTAALRKLTDKSELHLQQGLFYAAEDRLQEARGAFARAANAEREIPEAHYYLGLAAAARGDVLTAVKSLQRAVQLRPDDLTAAYQLALAAKAARQSGFQVVTHLPSPDPAALHTQQLAHWVAAEPDLIDAFLQHGGKGAPADPDEQDSDVLRTMLKAIRTALEAHPRYGDLHRYCSVVLERLGLTAEAVEHARRAVGINPGYAQALVQLGRLCAKQGRADQALEHLERAIACGADWPDVHCLVAELLADMRRTGEAAGHLRRALQLNPGYGRAARNLERLAA